MARGKQRTRSARDAGSAKGGPCKSGRPGADGSITRRQALGQMLGAGAGLLLAGGCSAIGVPALSGCSRSSGSGTPDVLQVGADDVVTLDGFTEIADTAGICNVVDLASLAAGTQLFATGKGVAAALVAGEKASPLSTVQLVDLEKGRAFDALGKAVGADAGYEIYAACASDGLLAWTECNYLTGDWAVYAAEMRVNQTSRELRDAAGKRYTSVSNEYSIGEAAKVDEGDGGYDAPLVKAIGANAYWIVQPAEGGARAKEDSVLKVSAGRGPATALCSSKGRFNGRICASGETLTVMPRAQASSGVYYQMTAISAASGQTLATQVLPRGYQPGAAVYMGGAFAFTIGASYDYGGGIANVGTYYPMPDGKWLRLTRQPVTAPGLCQGWLFSKSGARTAFVDMERRRYFTVNAPGEAADYGDYAACVGEVDAVCNYASITKGSAEKHVRLRRIELTAPS